MSDTLHILAIDDDPTSSFLLRQFIELRTSQRLRFDVATSVDEGMELLRQYQEERRFPQLIFVDVRLPTKDGFAFVEAFEQEYVDMWPSCTIYMLSSSMRDSDRNMSQQHPSVKRFVHKSDLDDQLDSILLGV